MQFSILLITLAALSFGSAATADGLTFGHLNLEYTDAQAGTSDRSNTVLEGAVEYEINQFLLSADLRYRRFEGYPLGTYGVTNYKLGAGYFITPEVLLGLNIMGENNDFYEANGYEIYGQYRNDVLGIAFNVEQPDTDSDFRRNSVMGQYAINEDVTAGARIEWRSNSVTDRFIYQLNAEYTEGPFDLRGHYSGFSDIDSGMLGARGYYNFSDDIRGYASYQSNVGADSADQGFYLIGGGYQIAEAVWIDAAYGGNLGEDLVDLERFTLTISFDTGTRQRLDDTFEQDIFDDRQDGFGLYPS